MKSEFDSEQNDCRLPEACFADEMRGYLDLGMHAEASALARRFLRRDPMEAGAFNAALDGLLVSQSRLKSWSRLVESSYGRLPKRAKRRARSAMLSFYCSLKDFEKAVRFIPSRLGGSMDVVDVAFAIDTLVNLNRLKEARVLVDKVMRGRNLACDEWVGGLLQSRLAGFYARDGDWERAIELFEPLRTHRGVAESAILGIVQLRLAQALRAINDGFDALREVNANPDAELAVTLQGNEEARWKETEQQLRKFEKKVRKAMADERWVELMLVGNFH